VPESVTAFFTEPADFAAALVSEGSSSLVITGHGRFRARLTRVVLHQLRLLAGEESLSRIAFITVPDHMILIGLQSGNHRSPNWGGIEMHMDEMITFGPGSSAHMRTDGACRWAAILMPVRDLYQYVTVMTGQRFTVPVRIRRWQIPRAAGRLLLRLHAAAIRAVETGHPEIIGREAAHGLDQQMISALVECLSDGSIAAEAPLIRRYYEIMVRFEDLLEKQGQDNARVGEISGALGLSQHILRRGCQRQLGMSPARYLRLRMTQREHPERRSRRRHGVVCITEAILGRSD
jgi:AraC-like DNA-binding protein